MHGLVFEDEVLYKLMFCMLKGISKILDMPIDITEFRDCVKTTYTEPLVCTLKSYKFDFDMGDAMCVNKCMCLYIYLHIYSY